MVGRCIHARVRLCYTRRNQHPKIQERSITSHATRLFQPLPEKVLEVPFLLSLYIPLLTKQQMKSSSSSSDVVLISVFHLLTDRASDGIYISHQHLETQISPMLHVPCFLEMIRTATVHHIGSHAEGWRGVPSAADLF